MECDTILQTGLNRMGITLEHPEILALCRYFAELTKWNRKMNLVAAAPEQETLESHFLDSLTLLPFLKSLDLPKRLLDVGTGAGFPGLALKAVLPQLQVTLVEPRQKRVSFLKHIIRTLSLRGIDVQAIRLEKNKTPASLVESFQVITSRAFTGISEFLELVEPLCQTGGKIVCMKGPKAQEEITVWQQKNPHSRLKLSDVRQFTLPFSNASRNLVIFTKEAASANG